MASTLNQVKYDELQSISKALRSESEAFQQLHSSTRSKVDALRSEWVGEAAKAFFREQEGTLLPAVQRVSKALAEAQSVLDEIMKITHDAEVETVTYFNWDDFVISEINRYGKDIDFFQKIGSLLAISAPLVGVEAAIAGILLPSVRLGELVFPSLGESDRIKKLIEEKYGEGYQLTIGGKKMDTSGLGNIIFGYYFQGPKPLENLIANIDQAAKGIVDGNLNPFDGNIDPKDDAAQRALGRWLRDQTNGDPTKITPQMLDDGVKLFPIEPDNTPRKLIDNLDKLLE